MLDSAVAWGSQAQETIKGYANFAVNEHQENLAYNAKTKLSLKLVVIPRKKFSLQLTISSLLLRQQQLPSLLKISGAALANK
jgi:hypothetical protein